MKMGMDLLTFIQHLLNILWVHITKSINSLSANFTKMSNTLKQFIDNLPTNCLSVFDHFVGLALKGLRTTSCTFSLYFFVQCKRCWISWTINPFVSNVPFLYPLKTSENLKVNLTFMKPDIYETQAIRNNVAAKMYVIIQNCSCNYFDYVTSLLWNYAKIVISKNLAHSFCCSTDWHTKICSDENKVF